MTALLFAIDHVFQIADDGNIYTTGGKFPYAAWQTYLEQFDDLVVFSRARPLYESDARTLSLASGARVRFCLTNARRGLTRLSSSLRDDAALKREIARADAVIGRLPSEYGLAATRYARAMNKPYMIELVACPSDALWNHGGIAAKLYAPILAARTRAAMRSTPLARYVTANFLQQRYPTHGMAIAASNVVLSLTSPPRVDERLQRLESMRRGHFQKPLIVGTIGALHTRLKGVHTAIAALSRARLHLPPFQYRILGEGDPARLAAQAQACGLGDQVLFDGVLPAGDAVARWLDEVDIYLQPSFQEGLPRGLIEALSRGCLAVGSTAGGIPELLPPERLHYPGDVAALECRVKNLWDFICSDQLALELSANIAKALKYNPIAIMAKRRASIAALKDQMVQHIEPATANV